MTQPTLDERFSGGPFTRADKTRNTWMTSEERRFILWGFKEGWSAARIGRELGVNEATVRRFRVAFKKSPETLLELGLQEKSGADD
jgi:DNA-binding NarL/FixJ family response regulator